MIHIDLWYTYIYTTQYIPTTDVSDVYQGMGKRHYLRVIRDARGRYVQFAYIWSYYTDNVKGWGGLSDGISHLRCVNILGRSRCHDATDSGCVNSWNVTNKRTEDSPLV